MKLHLPKGLFKAVLACCAIASSLITTTTVSSTALIGTVAFTLAQQQAEARIFTWTAGANNNNMHTEGNWVATDGAAIDYDGAGDLGFSLNNASANGRNIVQFVASDTTFKAPNTTFATLGLGGIDVVEGAEGYTLAKGGTRDVVWRASYDDDATTVDGLANYTNFTIAENFSVGASGATWSVWVYRANANFDVTTDKIFAIYASSFNFNGTQAAANGFTAPATNYEMLVQGGGTLDLNLTDYNLSRSANWTIQDNSTLDVAGVAAGATVTMGNLLMNGGTINMGTNGARLSSTMTVGAAGATLVGTNATLTGSIVYSEGGPTVHLNGSFIVANGLSIDLGYADALVAGDYVLMTREAGSTGLDADASASLFDIVGLDPLTYGGLAWVDDELVLTVADFAGSILTHADGNIEWSTDAADNLWQKLGTGSPFADGDAVTIGGADSTGGIVDIQTDVAPSSMTVTGDGEWVLSTANDSMIVGTTSLVKDGASKLTISLTNDYTGGTFLNAGTLALNASNAIGSGNLTMASGTTLELQHALGLGAADIIYGGGTIVYGTGIGNVDLSDDITLGDGVTAINVDINGNDVTWGTAIAGVNFNISNSSEEAGVLSYAGDLNGRTVNVEANASFLSTGTSAANGVTLTGSGTFIVNQSTNYFVDVVTGFTGTLVADNGAYQLLLNRSNTADSRYYLQTESVAAEATHNQAVIMGTADWSSGNTLYLRGLSGYSNITTSYDSVTNRGLNIEMTEDNSYHGNLYTAAAAGDSRWATWTIGTKQDDSVEGTEHYRFTWTGYTLAGTAYNTLGANANLLVKENTTMVFGTNDAGNGGGQYADDIALEAESSILEISRTDALGFIQRETNNAISGAGSVLVSGKATLNGTNTYTGGTTVLGGGTLNVGGANSLSSGNISVETDGSLSAASGLTTVAGQTITNAGAMTLGGTLTLIETVENTGTVTLLADTIFDLTNVAETSEGVYTLFTDGGTLDFSALSETGVLGLANLIGVETSGIIWTLNPDGTLSSEVDTNALFYSAGGAFAWNEGSVVDGGAVFAQGNSLIFGTADVDVTLATHIQSDSVTVEGIEATISGGEYTLTTGTITLKDNATLNIVGLDTVSAATKYYGEAGNVLSFDFGAGNSRTLNEQLVPFEGQVIIASGNLTVDSDAQGKLMTLESFTVLAGASLTSSGVSFNNADIDFILQGGEDASSAAVWNTSNATVNSNVTATGYTQINSDSVLNFDGVISSVGQLQFNATANTVNVRNSITGSGSIVKTGAGTLSFTTDNQIIAHTGTLDIQEGTLILGNATESDIDLYLEKIILREGTTMSTSLSAESIVDSVSLVLGGGTINHGNMGGYGDSIIQWNNLELIDGKTSTMNFNLKATFEFENLTGDGNLNITGAATEGNVYRMSFDALTNYKGTFTGVNNATYTLVINSAYQAAGYDAIINNVNVNSTNFVMGGEGSLTVGENHNNTGDYIINGGSLTITGTLTTDSFANNSSGAVNIGSLALNANGLMQMSYGGEMTLGDFTAAGEIRLSYDSSLTNTLLFAAGATPEEGQLAGVESIVLDLMGYSLEQLEAGINLGIYDDFDQANISVLGLTDYNIAANAEGYYVLTASSLVDLGWDSNWGDELAKRPLSVPKVADLPNDSTFLYGNAAYTVGDSTVIELTGGGGAAAQVYGGKSYLSNAGAEVIDTDVWIKATGGQFALLAGGSTVNNWQNANVMEFLGNTHIEVDGATVDHIVGGSLREGGRNFFTGDSFISVFTNTVAGSIVGAGTSRHTDTQGRVTTFNGNTNIYVYTPLTKSDAASAGDQTLRNDTIVGGHSWGAGGSTFNLTGNTNVTIDLSSYTDGEATMVKQIIAGGLVGGASTSNITGDTYLTIRGHEDVTFNDWIMGGINHNSNTPTSTINGSTNIEISGDSTFTQRVVGGGNHGGGTATITGATNFAITGGTYSNFIIGGFNQHTGTTSVLGGSDMEIRGASVTSRIYGASLIAAGNSTLEGGSNITLGAGSYSNVVLGFRKEGSTASTLVHAGDSRLTIDGSDLGTALAVGGSEFLGTATGSTLTQLGTTSIEVLNDAALGSIIGGSNITTASNNVSSGDVIISVSDTATITSNIIGGQLVTSSNQGALSTGNVSISVSANSNIGNIIGGHFIDGTGTITSLSLGDVTVSLADAATVESITGGSLIQRAITATQGVVTLNLMDGTIEGSVYAAGNLGAAAAVTTESTTVNLSSAVEFTGDGTIISGGYAGDDSAASVTGSRSLVLADAAATYDFGAFVSYHDFDTIEVTDADSSVVTYNALSDMARTVTKTGAGTLTLADVDHGSTALTISEGRVVSAGSLNSVNVAGGAVLDIGSGGTEISSLVLSNNAGLAYNSAGTGLALAGTLTLEGTNSKVNLSITGLPSSRFNETLFTGITDIANQLADLNFDKTIGDKVYFDANDYFSLNGAAFGSDAYVVYDEASDSVYLTDTISKVLSWNLSKDNWADADAWLTDDLPAELATFSQSDSVIFKGGAADIVTVNTDVTTTNFTVTDEGSIYSFTGDGRITVNGNLKVLDGATAVFDSVGLVNSDVTVNESSVLMIKVSATMLSLNNTGTVEVSKDLILQKATSNGGQVDVGGNLTLAGNSDASNTFNSLTVDGDVTNSSILSVYEDSRITGALSGGSLIFRANEGSIAPISRIGSVTNALNSFDNQSRENDVFINSGLEVTGAFSNMGFVNLEGALTLGVGTSEGGNVSATNVTLTGANTFTKLVATGDVSGATALSLGSRSEIDGTLAGEDLSLAISGEVTIETISGTLADLSIEGGISLTVNSNLTVEGAFTNTAALEVEDLTLQTATTQGGNIRAKNVTLTGDNEFNSILANEITTAGNLTLNGDTALSQVISVTGVEKLTINNLGGFFVTTTGATSFTSIAGTGILSVGGNLSLSQGGSIGGLTVYGSALTLGGALAVDGTMRIDGAAATINVNYVIDKNLSLIATDSFTGATSANFVISAADITSIGLGTGETITLMDTNDGSSLTSVTINGLSELEIGSYKYTISQNAIEGDILLSATLTGNSWQSDAEGDWGTAANWVSGVPSATEAAIFSGNGSSAVNVNGAGIASSILVDVQAGATITSYTISGDAISTGTLTVRNGTLVIENSIDVLTNITGDAASSLGNLIVDTTGVLSIQESGSVTAATGSLTGEASLSVGTEASLNITGDMSVSSTKTDAFSNAGTVTVQGALSTADSVNIVNTGKLSVGDGSDISALSGDGGSFDILANSQVIVDTINQGSVQIGEGSGLSSTDAQIAQLSNMGTLNADALSITGNASQLGTANVGELSLVGTGHTAGMLKVDMLNLGELDTVAKLSVNSISELTVGDGMVELDFDMAAPTITGSSYSYAVIAKGADAALGLDWDNFTLSGDTQNEFNDLFISGMDAVLSDSNGSLSVVVTETTGRVWYTSNDVAATPGMEGVVPPMHYDVVGADGKIVSYAALNDVSRVVIDQDVTVDLTALTLDPSDSQGLIMKNLSGSEGKTMTIVGSGTGADQSLVTLYTDENAISAAAQSSIVATDTTIQVEGLGETNLGSLDMTDGMFIVHQGGTITLSTASFDNTKVVISQAAVTRAATPGKSTVIVDNVTFENGASLEVEANGIYEVTDTLEVTGATSSLTVKQGGLLDASDADTIVTDSSITVEDGGTALFNTVDLKGNSSLTELEGGKVVVKSLSGDDTSSLSGDIEITGSDGKFLGTYVGITNMHVEAGASQDVVAGANLYLTGAEGAKITINYKSTTNSELGQLSTTGSHVTLAGSVLGESLTLGNASSMTGGSLGLTLDADNLTSLLAGDAAAVVQSFFSGAEFTLNNVSLMVGAADATGAGIASIDITGLGDGITLGNVGNNISASSSGNSVLFQGTMGKYFTNGMLDSNGNIVADLNDAAYNGLGVTHNGMAGTALLSKAMIELNPQVNAVDSDLDKVLDTMDIYLSNGNKAAADALGAAVAGASVTSMGSSMLSSVERQLQNVRNRTMSMGGNPMADTDGPFYNAWISAEGGYNKLESDSTSAGHEYSSFGGSFGMDVEIDSNLTLGMAFTALYGTVDSSAADVGEGELNTYNISAFGRLTHGRWNHSFVATLGMADANLERTVNYGGGSYKTEGDTTGFGLGFMYEVGYSYTLNEEATMAWQPVFNVSLVHASLDGYTEDGGNAALEVGDQDSTYVTFGLGGRFEAVVGENTFNRSAVFTSRAMLKFDAGDRFTEADVSIAGTSGAGSVVGAEPGAVGLELGAGLNIPIGGETGTLFMDAGVEFRDGQNSVNASVGYRFSF